MPNAKRFLITSETSEMIVVRQAGGETSDGKCPLCGAEVTSLAGKADNSVAALPSAPDKADQRTKQDDEEEKQK